MSQPVSRRVQRVKPSPTLAVTARAARLKAEGRDVIGLGAGEPDFDTPPHIADAGINAIRSGQTRYTNVAGTDALKDAIIGKFRRDNGLTYTREQVLVSCGAKHTLFNLCLAVLDPGDEAIIPAPCWVSYPDMVLLADGVPVMPFAGAEQGYKITAQQLEQAITPRTRLVLLNSPCNPTGAAFTRTELLALGEVLLAHPRILIGTDDMYEKIWWGEEPFCSLVTAVPALYDRTVTINGVSKAYAMTGWRIGYCGGPPEVIRAMATLQGQSTTNAASMSQQAAIAALAGDQACVTDMNRAFRERHDYVVAALNGIHGIRCMPGSGTFYAFADVSDAMRSSGCADDGAFAEMLLNEAGVAVVPGAGFGAPGHVRLSFACDLPTLHRAIERIDRAVRAASATRQR